MVELLSDRLKKTWALAESLNGVSGVAQIRKDYCDTCNDIIDLLKEEHGLSSEEVNKIWTDIENE